MGSRTVRESFDSVSEARRGRTTWKRSLDGPWKFAYLTSPALVTADHIVPETRDESWPTITVPGTWQTQGYGRPHYTNVLYPFPEEPCEVPETDNPTGVYRRRTCPRMCAGCGNCYSVQNSLVSFLGTPATRTFT